MTHGVVFRDAFSSGGKVNEDHVTVAVIIEMVHLATLVHDDVMDEAEIRRGRLTLAAKFPNGKSSGFAAVWVTDTVEFLDQEPNDNAETATPFTLPSGLSGRLLRPGREASEREQDRRRNREVLKSSSDHDFQSSLTNDSLACRRTRISLRSWRYCSNSRGKRQRLCLPASSVVRLLNREVRQQQWDRLNSRISGHL